LPSKTLTTFLVIYLATAACWAFCWIPFGFGYYDFPWASAAFRPAIQIWAWLHLLAGATLIIAALRSRRRRASLAGVFALGLSMFSIWAMYNWLRRWLGHY